jgi:hypothetical protein
MDPETWLRRITPAHVLGEVLDLVAAPASAPPAHVGTNRR